MDIQPIELLEQLTEDVASARALLELINLEFQALNVRDLEQIQELLTRKQPLIAQLEFHGNERAALLRARNLPVSRQGLQKFFEQTEQRSQALTLTDTLEYLLAACRQANDRNGRAINTTQAAITYMLGILRGTAKTPALYDRWGSAEKTGRQRSLSQA